MQRPDEKKRRLIVATAARMFATLPYHKVRLDDIAAAAHIGKGTLYIYFDNKEDLYVSLIYDGFEKLVDNLRGQLDESASAASMPAIDALRVVVDELVGFAFAHPHFFELMRSAGELKRMTAGEWQRKREEFVALVAQTIRRGMREGTLNDPSPDMTAVCLGGMVRSIMLFGPKGLQQKYVADHVYRLLVEGIAMHDREPRRVRSSSAAKPSRAARAAAV